MGDLQEDSHHGWPELCGDVQFRSVVFVPVVYGGDAVGVVVLENRIPTAYGPPDENLLLRAAMLLGPVIGNPSNNSQGASRDDESVAFNRLTQILSNNRRLDEVFEDFASTVGTLVEFDRMTLAWLDPSGCDLFSISSCPSSSDGHETPEVGFLTHIRTTLRFGQHDIGTLTLWRRRDELFEAGDVVILERLGIQVSAIVQYDRLYRLARCQSYQLSQSEAVSTLAKPKEQMQLDSLQHKFLVDTAHSLRSPLSSIKGYSSTLLQSDVSWPPEAHQEFLETIDREADQLNRAINDLLKSMESDSSAVQFDRSLVPVQNVLQVAETELVGDQCIPASFRCEPGLPLVLVDQARIAQVIVYLANCAHRAASSGATLIVQARREEEHIRISIGLAHQQTVISNAIGSPPSQAIRDRKVVPTWIQEGLMQSVCLTLLFVHGVDLRHGTPERQEEIFWFDLAVKDSQHRDVLTKA